MIKLPRCHVYLLRFWAEWGENPERPTAQRFILEDPHSGKRRGFGNLEALTAFLESEVNGMTSSSDNGS